MQSYIQGSGYEIPQNPSIQFPSIYEIPQQYNQHSYTGTHFNMLLIQINKFIFMYLSSDEYK